VSDATRPDLPRLDEPGRWRVADARTGLDVDTTVVERGIEVTTTVDRHDLVVTPH
jgi:hypothetical protein